MEERRREERSPVDTPGIFLRDGLICKIKLRDLNASGIGAYSCCELKPGQQGVLLEKLPSSTEPEGLPSEVCWCFREGSGDALYPYRVGLRIL